MIAGCVGTKVYEPPFRRHYQRGFTVKVSDLDGTEQNEHFETPVYKDYRWSPMSALRRFGNSPAPQQGDN